MKPRLAITLVWLAGLALAVVVVEAYFARRTPEGIPWLLPDDRPPAYEMLASIYGAAIGAMLGCWFVKPFPPLRHKARLRIVAALAVGLTVAYNLLLLFLLAQGHWAAETSLPDILERTRKIAGTLAFLVVPSNAAYFGLKPPPA